jgi:DNA-binding NarL/FixJ family response regulator
MVATDSFRVLVIDDQAAIRDSLRAFLQVGSRWRVCGEAADGAEGVRAATRLEPDLIIMDIAMPCMDGIQATREIRKALPATPILMLSFHDSPHMVTASFRAGATGYVLKANLARDLLRAVETVARRQRFLSDGLREQSPDGRGGLLS